MPPPAAPTGRALGGGSAMSSSFTAPAGPSYGRGGNNIASPSHFTSGGRGGGGGGGSGSGRGFDSGRGRGGGGGSLSGGRGFDLGRGGGRGGGGGGRGRGGWRDRDDLDNIALPKQNFDGLIPLEKKFYKESPTEQEVAAYRKTRDITVEGQDVPRPIRAFREANFPGAMLNRVLS